MADVAPPSWVEQVNSLIRGGVLGMLTIAFCYKFLDGTVSTDAFISIFAGVLGWWFATRGNQGQTATAVTPNGVKDPAKQ